MAAAGAEIVHTDNSVVFPTHKQVRFSSSSVGIGAARAVAALHIAASFVYLKSLIF